MGSVRYRLFNPVLFFVFLLIFSIGCSTSPKGGDAEAAIRIPPPVVNKISAMAELSVSKTSDGSIVLVSVMLPREIPDTEVVGDFDGISLPFYRTRILPAVAPVPIPVSAPGAAAVAGPAPAPAPQMKARYEAVLGVPYGTRPGANFVAIKITDGGETSTLVLALEVVEGDYSSETLKADNKYVKPNTKDQERMKRESVEIHEVYETLTRRKFWNGPFQFPIKSDVTSRFGTKRIFNGELKSFHTGLDLKAKVPTPIRAAAPGVVLLAKNLFMTGNTVILDHGFGVMTLYAHMSRIKVKKGAVVQKNALLGISGKTGRVSGPHLHWMAIIHKMKVNPLDLTRVMR